MSLLSESGARLRRSDDLPVLVLSQDYELFFHDSGSIEKCLFEPGDMLLEFARKHGVHMTFFVDAGMLVAMHREAQSPTVATMYDRVRAHIASIAGAGHEIGLHVHPHWEDTAWRDDRWDFHGARYQLRDFDDAEVERIFESYSIELNDLCDGAVRSYRAGGFCIEPFTRIKPHLKRLGIGIDSSIVPRAVLVDADKGFDFSRAPEVSWWRFDESPTRPVESGHFVEIPITSVELPLMHYWGRLVERVSGRRRSDQIGDGTSKVIGKKEILRRLAGAGRISELSVDAPKAAQLVSRQVRSHSRDVWHVMGHPKLLGPSSLQRLERFLTRQRFAAVETVANLARRARGT